MRAHLAELHAQRLAERRAEIAAYSEAAKKASALLERLGLTEDEVVAEFDALRKARRGQREAASAS